MKTKRKTKAKELSPETKIVQIDKKTWIEVSVDIPDDEARKRFYKRHKLSELPTHGRADGMGF